ncbi:MAG: hypothetical protein P4N60_04025 [Verrucomicrobiae bacterium]|nr:hypothetical protein [Verrucomicrobiae bacterium]
MSTKKKSSGREIAGELFAPGYFDRARQRATRRKSRWNLLLLPAVILGIGSVVFFIVRLADIYLGYRGCPPLFSPDTPEWKQIVVVCGALFVSMPVGMVLANVLVWLIPPARRALNAEAKGRSGTDYRTSQRHLIYISRKMVKLYRRLLGQL